MSATASWKDLAFAGAKDGNKGTRAPDKKNWGDLLYKVVEVLRGVKNHAPVTADFIKKHVGVDLLGAEAQMDSDLRDNPRVAVTMSESGDIFYAYKAKYPLKNSKQLVSLIETQHPRGLPVSEISDCYPTVLQDVNELVRCGALIAVKSAECSEDVLFPRGLVYLTRLSAEVQGRAGEQCVRVATDVSEEVRKGDALKIGDSWYRLCAASGAPAEFQMSASTGRDAWQYSVSTRKLNKATEEKSIHGDGGPSSGLYLQLDRKLHSDVPPPPRATPAKKVGDGVKPGASAAPVTEVALKYGCSNDIRQMWKDTLIDWPDPKQLEQKLLNAKLITQDKLSSRKRPTRQHKIREKTKVARKQRDYSKLKLTNVHLEGTDLGSFLQ